MTKKEGIGIYLKQIGRRQLLTKQQEIECSQMIEGYKPTTDKKVKKQVRKIIRAIQLSTASER